ncbi:MAG: DUF1810 domain-containing protein [Pseudomonadota bacterium]|nr:DUF1810 domain-containing protein [Pseudomonadota bacterium]
MADPFNLARFVSAQEPLMRQVHAELTAGRKQSHWMWFVFPQLAGLGRSDVARVYAISSLDEARGYLAHPILGPRLTACTHWVNGVRNRTARQIFGTPDDLKFQSCMTLFALADPTEQSFREALAKYFDGARDRFTEDQLS